MTDPLRLLVLGGTSWLGGTVASLALQRGHEVTCLARGESGSVPAGATHVRSDRWASGAYNGVVEREWDAVVDVSWQPELVRSALSALAERARHWLYVSSISVYADHNTPGADESAAVLEPWSGTGEVGREAYGSAKVSCETACRDAVDDERLLVARAGLIVGYGDRSDRFGYWPARFARAADGEEVLAPSSDVRLQVIDVLDLAGWLVDSAERRGSGTYDATGPCLTFADMAATCADVTGVRPHLIAPGDSWLQAADVEAWAGPESLPLWLPQDEYAGHASRAAGAAKSAGLTARSLRDSVSDALRWERECGLGRPRQAGLSAEREADLLRRWHGK